MYKVRRNRRFQWKSRNNVPILLAVSFFAILGANCSLTESETRPAALVPRVDEFLPLDGGQKEASYLIDGTKADYRLEIKKDGTKTQFTAMSHDAVIDTEIYDVRESSVLLVHALGEDFSDPIPLMKFPLRLGEPSEWKGTLNCGDQMLKAKATINTSSDFVHLKDRNQDAVKVEVDLDINEVGTRKLSFWFVKGMGILKTELGKNVREPKI